MAAASTQAGQSYRSRAPPRMSVRRSETTRRYSTGRRWWNTPRRNEGRLRPSEVDLGFLLVNDPPEDASNHCRNGQPSGR